MPVTMSVAVAASLAFGFSFLQHSEAVGREHLIRGISYGPVPLTSVEGASELPEDDWFCNEALPMWGRPGRGDLRVMKQLGANLVRLYGNDPQNDHTNFLDEAESLGLAVAPGMSDWPYYQETPGSCKDTDFNCFSQIKPLYLQNLQKGFLKPDGSYHPALKYFNILNEPDLKMPSTAAIGGPDGLAQMSRTLVSAFDAMLDAEKEAGVVGPKINFTATFSFAMCLSCSREYGPALAQMVQLDDAMRHPEKYGYEPVNNVTEAYLTRFTHSFNTANPASDLKSMFFDGYVAKFPQMPVYIAEYHSVHVDQSSDLEAIFALAEETPLFLGISYFEYQVAYWKAGTEREFGLFGFSDQAFMALDYFNKTFNVHCLVPQLSPYNGANMPQALARAYGGTGFEDAILCTVNPAAISSWAGNLRGSSALP
mmetsp:Transcript_102092/g.259445  ORF Transcript_102092/g.259445 Transcript_102092/m.259445 type:complete len:425 (+) Transcript_102092:47-1321(+)